MTASLSLHDPLSCVLASNHMALKGTLWNSNGWPGVLTQRRDRQKGGAVQFALGASVHSFMADSPEWSVPSCGRSWGGCSAALAASGAVNQGLARTAGTEESQAA